MDTLPRHLQIPIPAEDHHNHRDERVEFALFLKVLLRCLERSKEYFILQQARLVVMTCTRGHKMGDPSFHPLVEQIEIRLKKLVGDRIWKQARALTRFYLKKQLRGQAGGKQRCLPYAAAINDVARPSIAQV